MTKSGNGASNPMKGERFLRAALEASGAGIIVIESNLMIAGTNRQFVEMWGLRGDVLRGRSLDGLFELIRGRLKRPDAEFKREMALLGDNAETANGSMELKDGRVFGYSSSPLVDDGGAGGRVWSFHDITAGRRKEEELEERIKARTADLETESARSRRLESLLREIGERERERLGRDLHDMLGQTLTALAMKGEVLKNKLFTDSSEHTMEASKMLDAIKEAMKQARNLSRLLCPVKIESQPIRDSLMELCMSMRGGFGIDCRTDFKGLKGLSGLGSERKVNIYRIAQEAINNAMKHGKCKVIKVSLSARCGEGVLTIEDDGCGLSAPDSRSEGLGLSIMRSRAEMLGGSLELASRSPSGVEVKCVFPLKVKEE